MRTPSTKRLMDAFKISRETALLIKRIGRAADDGEVLRVLVSQTPELSGVQKEISTHGAPWWASYFCASVAVRCIAELIPDAYGTEGFDPTEKYGSTYPYEYVNRGDPYVTTLIYSRKDGADNLFIGAWGDIAEREG